MHSAVAVGAAAFNLARSNLLSQRQILCRYVHAIDIVIVSASGYTKEASHFTDTVLLLMTVDNFIFDAGFYFLSVSERKSRNNSTSIFKLLFSYLYS